MGTKNKRHKQKPMAFKERMKRVGDDILSGVISGLIVALFTKWLNS